MAEYIERSAAIEAAKHAWAKGLEPSQYIEILPVADVAPVVHGLWEKEPSSFWRWTPSGAVAVTRTTYRCGFCGRGTAVKSNYCPRCGAKMDGGADNGRIH
jgi:hypothetical protein